MNYLQKLLKINAKKLKTMKKIIASATTLENLENLLNKYYYSTTYKIHPDLTITNSKGVFDSVFIKQIKNRYAIYSK